jgi:hypothetical protein
MLRLIPVRHARRKEHAAECASSVLKPGNACIITDIFWVAMFLMLAAVVSYVMTEDLAWAPQSQSQPPLFGA